MTSGVGKTFTSTSAMLVGCDTNQMNIMSRVMLNVSTLSDILEQAEKKVSYYILRRDDRQALHTHPEHPPASHPDPATSWSRPPLQSVQMSSAMLVSPR